MERLINLKKPGNFAGNPEEFRALVASASSSESEAVKSFLEKAEDEEFETFSLFLENADKHLGLSFDQLEELKVLLIKNLRGEGKEDFLRAMQRANQILQFQGRDGLLDTIQAKRRARDGAKVLVEPALACLLAVFLTVGIAGEAFSSTDMEGMTFREVREFVTSGNQESDKKLPFKILGMKTASNGAWRAVESEIRHSREPITKIARKVTEGVERVYFYYEGEIRPSYSWSGRKGESDVVESVGGAKEISANLLEDGFRGSVDQLKESSSRAVFSKLSKNQREALGDFLSNITSNPQVGVSFNEYTLSSGKTILIPLVSYFIGGYEVKVKFLFNRTEITAKGKEKELGGQETKHILIKKGGGFSSSDILSLINGQDDPENQRQ